MSCPARIYPLRKPRNHRLPIPRWQIAPLSGINSVFTAYIGVQQRSDDQAATRARNQAVDKIRSWLSKDDGPAASESFTVIDGSDVADTAVWVCYWTDESKFQRGLETLSLPSIYSKLATPGRSSIGIWRESFSTAVSRLETNYSGLDYLPGLARTPGANTTEHSLSAYWGAARDRIPDSAHDLFLAEADAELPENIPTGLGQYLVGTNCNNNLVHIRSGQFWENCNQQEADAYERNLEPTLRAGLEYLWDKPRETGALGLRYLRNADPTTAANGQLHKETCGAGFFTDLETLENWAKTHRLHLAIYRGAMAHFKAFGDARKLRTWHEVSVLRDGEARFEYSNCQPNTGVMGCIPLRARELIAE